MVASPPGCAPKFTKTTITGAFCATLPWSVDSLASKTAHDRIGIVSQHRYSFRADSPGHADVKPTAELAPSRRGAPCAPGREHRAPAAPGLLVNVELRQPHR